MRKIATFLVLALIIMQFFRPDKNISTVVSANDINTKYPVPDSVMKVLQRSCGDCHTNNTNYPWYSNVQPVAWFMSDHIADGKRKFNLSEFASYTNKRAAHKLEEVVETTEGHSMPISSYLWMHSDAKLNEQELAMIKAWALELKGRIETAQ